MTRRLPAGTMRPRRRNLQAASLALLAVLATLAAGCTPGTTRTTFPPAGFTPPQAGTATDAARQELLGALGELGLLAADAQRPYRPTEGPLLAWAPRTTLQVTLPDDPNHGFVIIYAFGSPQAAATAAKDHAAYVASSIGRVNFSRDTRHVLRIVGSSVVSFAWTPEAAPDPRTRSIEDALLRIGSGVPIPA
jgi:hypothetical protein